MKALRIGLSLAIVASTSMLVGILAFDRLSGTNNDPLVSLLLQIMHGSFLIGSVIFSVHQIQQRQWSHLILTLAPIGSFMLAIAGVLFGVKPPNVTLLLFDLYLILYYFYLLLKELSCFERNS